MRTFASILKNTPPSKIFNIYEEVSVSEKKALMMELLESDDTISIEDLIVDKSNPLHIICSFMAILESVKDKLVIMRQDELYGPIILTRRPEEWDPRTPDEIDRDAEIAEAEADDSAPEDFNILTREAEMRLEDMIKANEEFSDDSSEEEEYVGDEEEIILEDEDE